VDELFGGGVKLGIPLLAANFPRAYLDVNREPFELDEKMFEGELPHYVNTTSTRVAAGLGTIARIVSEREEIYISKLPVETALERINDIYKPYHASLRHLLAKTHVQFGYAVLLDCHSMPSAHNGSLYQSRPDIIIGDRFGNSCSAELSGHVGQCLIDLGYKVEFNKPYAGGFITQHYGRPENGLHALQIEINRGLYMNEVKMCKSAGFDDFTADITRFLSRLVAMPEGGMLGTYPLAAE